MTPNPYTPAKKSAFAWALSDSWVLTQRSLRHILTNKDQLLGLAIQPIMFMLLFRYVFGGAIETGSTTYVNFLTAGILIQMAAFGALTTSLSLSALPRPTRAACAAGSTWRRAWSRPRRLYS